MRNNNHTIIYSSWRRLAIDKTPLFIDDYYHIIILLLLVVLAV
jgi:hypothetical protein